tara:strand:+ start:448 stop:609 length:162 start_codon:yes stop_codon:yes gene_type:complete
MQKEEIKVAVAGLGNVGSGVYEILVNQIDLINKRSTKNLKLVAVSARSKKRFC